MSDAFPCNGCGACCKSILLSELTSWLDRGDGVCKFFDAMHNICTIYENRPDVCNVRVMYEKYYKDVYFWPEFVAINLMACKTLLLHSSQAPAKLEKKN